jgi:hypothetical protein
MSRSTLGSAVALKEKGLRHLDHRTGQCGKRFSSSPEGKGIETLRRICSLRSSPSMASRNCAAAPWPNEPERLSQSPTRPSAPNWSRRASGWCKAGAAVCRFEAASAPQVSRTIFPAYRRDSSAVSASLASGKGKTLATRGLSRPASHQRSNSARLRLIRTGSRSACAPQTTPMTETFLTRIRFAGTAWIRPIVARSWCRSRPRSCEAHQLCRPPPPQAQAAYDLLDLGQVGYGQARGGWPSPRADAVQHGPRLSPPRHVDKDARHQHPERLGPQIHLEQPIVRHVAHPNTSLPPRGDRSRSGRDHRIPRRSQDLPRIRLPLRDPRPKARRFVYRRGAEIHAEARSIFGFHLRLYARARPASRRSRPAATLRRQPRPPSTKWYETD